MICPRLFFAVSARFAGFTGDVRDAKPAADRTGLLYRPVAPDPGKNFAQLPPGRQGNGEGGGNRQGDRATPQTTSPGPRKVTQPSAGPPRALPRAFETPRCVFPGPDVPRPGVRVRGPNLGSIRTPAPTGVSIRIGGDPVPGSPDSSVFALTGASEGGPVRPPNGCVM